MQKINVMAVLAKPLRCIAPCGSQRLEPSLTADLAAERRTPNAERRLHPYVPDITNVISPLGGCAS